VIEALATRMIDARPFFTPLPALDVYPGSDDSRVPVARRLHEQGVSIPSSASLDQHQQDRVIDVLRGP
jgi:dTDP-4-amino-4,6-dideoxygalactose transaminase